MKTKKLKKLVKSLLKAQIETDIQMKETDRQMKETDIQMKKTDEKLKKIGVLTGNISNNQGAVAEEFFFNSLEKSKKIGKLKFDYVESNIKNRLKDIEDEFDIVAYNGNSILIVETKYKFHPQDVEKMKNKKIPNFKKLFPNYQNYKIYGAIAGFNIPKDSIIKAKENGLFVLKRVGNIADVDFENIIAY